MKKLVILFALMLMATPSLFAVPKLQVYIDGATYDEGTQTWVTEATDFDLYVIGNGTFDEVFVSMAIGGIGEFGDPSGVSTMVDGTPYPAGTWTWGYAPITNNPGSWDGGNNDLPKHDVFPAWYTEFSAGAFGQVGGIGNTVQDSADANVEPFWVPTDGYINSNFMGEYKKFTISYSGAGALHFDAYTKNADGTIQYFAPFSHDAGSQVPEPATALLMGLGLAGASIVRRFRKKS